MSTRHTKPEPVAQLRVRCAGMLLLGIPEEFIDGPALRLRSLQRRPKGSRVTVFNKPPVTDILGVHRYSPRGVWCRIAPRLKSGMEPKTDMHPKVISSAAKRPYSEHMIRLGIMRRSRRGLENRYRRYFVGSLG